MKHLFTLMIFSSFFTIAYAAEVSTDCPAMNQERSNPKASLKVVKTKRPVQSGASKQ